MPRARRPRRPPFADTRFDDRIQIEKALRVLRALRRRSRGPATRFEETGLMRTSSAVLARSPLRLPVGRATLHEAGVDATTENDWMLGKMFTA
jgi:hypothetical protein